MMHQSSGEFNAMLQTDLGDSTMPSSSSLRSPTQAQEEHAERNEQSMQQRSMIRGGLNRAEGPVFSDNGGILHRYVSFFLCP